MATERSNYLYGDSTESTLKTNFLEFLRDAIDFSVAALKSDQRIDKARARIEALKVEAARHTADLEAFVTVVTSSIESAPKEADSPTMQCATHLESLSRDALTTFKNVIAGKLQADIAQAESEERAARQASLIALGALLAPHDPPDSTSTSKITTKERRKAVRRLAFLGRCCSVHLQDTLGPSRCASESMFQGSKYRCRKWSPVGSARVSKCCRPSWMALS
jgi:hypothetical protein